MQQHAGVVQTREKFEDDAMVAGSLVALLLRNSTVVLYRYSVLGMGFEIFSKYQGLTVTLTLLCCGGARRKARRAHQLDASGAVVWHHNNISTPGKLAVIDRALGIIFTLLRRSFMGWSWNYSMLGVATARNFARNITTAGHRQPSHHTATMAGRCQARARARRGVGQEW
jgi:hypothetical protein